MKVQIEFEKLQALCKYSHNTIDQDKNIETVCDHPSNNPRNCSWSRCNTIDCPFCRLIASELFK
ncbi:MAG: hypothetical protein J6U54_17760 [Clostridiales bacterium]|nr:hypothetical protein [Clostridiales bacterium]